MTRNCNLLLMPIAMLLWCAGLSASDMAAVDNDQPDLAGLILADDSDAQFFTGYYDSNFCNFFPQSSRCLADGFYLGGWGSDYGWRGHSGLLWDPRASYRGLNLFDLPAEIKKAAIAKLKLAAAAKLGNTAKK